MQIGELEGIFSEAARIEKLLTDPHRVLIEGKPRWPDYPYDKEDRKHWIEAERCHIKITGKQIDFLDKTLEWLQLLGKDLSKRTIYGKKIIWARANGFSYREIAGIAGMPPKTVEFWYKRDIAILASKVE